MTLALTSFHAYGIDMTGPTKKRGIQRAFLAISGVAGDNVLDIGNLTGTFWTAAQANAATGALATKALALLTTISANASGIHAIESKQLLTRQQVASGVPGSVGQFSVALTSNLPTITVAVGDGVTAWGIILEWTMNDGIMPVSFS